MLYIRAWIHRIEDKEQIRRIKLWTKNDFWQQSTWVAWIFVQQSWIQIRRHESLTLWLWWGLLLLSISIALFTESLFLVQKLFKSIVCLCKNQIFTNQIASVDRNYVNWFRNNDRIFLLLFISHRLSHFCPNRYFLNNFPDK